MSFSQKISQMTKRFIDTYQKNQVLRVLLEMSDAQLEDIGVSRYQLSRGIAAYPWREAIADNKQNTQSSTQSNTQSADVLSFQRPVTPDTETVEHEQPKLAA